MAFKANMKHPNFILGVVSFILLVFGVIVKGNGYREGDYGIIASVVMAPYTGYGVLLMWLKTTGLIREAGLSG